MGGFSLVPFKTIGQARPVLTVPLSTGHAWLAFYFHSINLQCGFVAIDHPNVMR